MDEETLPSIRVVTEDYNPEDSEHVRQYRAAGSPNLALDNWRPSFYEDLDGETYVRRPYPEPPASLTDVEKAIIEATDNFRQARLAAPVALDRLKGTVLAALLGAGMDRDEATAAGVGLVLLHGPLLAAFEAAGGHPVAGQALYAAISSAESVAALPWLKPEILAIFAAALTPK